MREEECKRYAIDQHRELITWVRISNNIRSVQARARCIYIFFEIVFNFGYECIICAWYARIATKMTCAHPYIVWYVSIVYTFIQIDVEIISTS